MTKFRCGQYMNYLLLLAVPAGNSHDNIILFQLWLGHDRPPAPSCIYGFFNSNLWFNFQVK